MQALMHRPVAHLKDHDRVLLIRLGAVGDVLRTLPALHLLRRTYPGLHLTWVVEDPSRDLLVGHPEIDELIVFPRRELRELALRPRRLASRLTALAEGLRERRFGVAIDFQGSFKSGLLARMSGAPRRVGFAPGHCREFSFLWTNEWVRPLELRLNRVERNLIMAERLGATGDEVEVILPELADEGREAESILESLNPAGVPVVVLSPGTSRRQRWKRWPVEHYARLASLLRSSLGALPLVAWGPGEEGLARSIASGCHGHAVVAPPSSLRLLAAILRRCALFVGADTGPMHLAWGMGCPVVALFGPTDPLLNAPLGPAHLVLRSGRSTSNISPEEVLRAAGTILGRRSAPTRTHRLSRAALFPRAVGAGP